MSSKYETRYVFHYYSTPEDRAQQTIEYLRGQNALLQKMCLEAKSDVSDAKIELCEVKAILSRITKKYAEKEKGEVAEYEDLIVL